MNNKSDHELAQVIWDYMRYEQPLEKADVIIGLGSTDVRTADWCAKLYHDGYASRILFSGARGRITRDVFTENEADVYEQRALELHVPAAAILKDTKAVNTGENIQNSAAILADIGATPQRIIIVTTPYMLRRAYATFAKQWPAASKPEIMCSAIDATFDEYCSVPEYTQEYVINVMVGDLQRIREYPKLGFQIEQDIPQEVWAAYEELVRRGYTKDLIGDGNESSD